MKIIQKKQFCSRVFFNISLLLIFILSAIGVAQAAQKASSTSEKKPFFMAYYPTWFAPFHNAYCDQSAQYYSYDPTQGNNGWKPCTPGNVIGSNGVPDDYAIKRSALLAGGIPDYVTHVVISFAKLNQMRTYTGLSQNNSDLLKLGLSLHTSSESLKESIRVLKQQNPGTKVILALGGAAYNDSWAGVTGEDIKGTAKLIEDLGLDGLDVDYEIGGIDDNNILSYYNAVKQMRDAVDIVNQKPGKTAILTLPGWSTGASCTEQTKDKNRYPDCYLGQDEHGNDRYKISYFGANPGRERLLLQGPVNVGKKPAKDMLDLITIMSYDADYQHFDPVTAYQDYKNIVKPGTPVGLGIQPSPDEGWGNARTLVDERGINNDCVGNTILEDQYRKQTPGTFSVQRLAEIVKQNPGDGMMMWSLFAGRPVPAPNCGSVKLSTPTDLARGVSKYLNIGTDTTTSVDKAAADIYGRH